MSYGQNTGGSSKPVETGKEYTVDITDTGKIGRWHCENTRLYNICKRRKGWGQKCKDQD